MTGDRSYGRQTQTLLKRQSAFGTTATGNFVKIPFISNPVGMNQGLVRSPRAGGGRGTAEMHKDVPVVGGNIVVPVCLRNIGFFLTGLLGDPSTSVDTGVYTHTFTSEDDDLPCYSMEAGHPSVPSYNMTDSLKVNTMELSFSRGGGPANATFGLIGRNETLDDATNGGTPTSQTLAWASLLQGQVKQGGSALASLNSGSFSYSNNLESIPGAGQADGLVEGIDAGDPTCSGALNLRFATTDHLDAAVAGTPVDLEFIYAITASLSLTMTVHEAYLEKIVPPIEGPGGVVGDFRWEGVRNAAAGKMLTAVLVNNLAGTVYTS